MACCSNISDHCKELFGVYISFELLFRFILKARGKIKENLILFNKNKKKDPAVSYLVIMQISLARLGISLFVVNSYSITF